MNWSENVLISKENSLNAKEYYMKNFASLMKPSEIILNKFIRVINSKECNMNITEIYPNINSLMVTIQRILYLVVIISYSQYYFSSSICLILEKPIFAIVVVPCLLILITANKKITNVFYFEILRQIHIHSFSVTSQITKNIHYF